MKLLLDENISDKIAPGVDDLFPDSTHVKTVGLIRADDSVIVAGEEESQATHGVPQVPDDASLRESDGGLSLPRPSQLPPLPRGIS